MPEVDRYRIVLYGTSEATPNLNAKVELYRSVQDAPGGREQVISMGKVRFWADSPPSDVNNKGNPVMNLPAAMLPQVIDVLRNESPVYYAFHEGRAVLGTAVEPIGSCDETVPRLVRVVPEDVTPPATQPPAVVEAPASEKPAD